MKRKWFLVERVSTLENPADLKAKPFSRERCEFLMKKIGLTSRTFNEENMHGGGNKNTKLKHVMRAIIAMLMAGKLQDAINGDFFVDTLLDVDTDYLAGIFYVGFGDFGCRPRGCEPKDECKDGSVQGGLQSNQ